MSPSVAVRASLLWDLVCTSCKSKSQGTHAASLPHAVQVLTLRNAGTKLKKKAEYPSEPGGKCDEMIGWWWLARVKVTLYPPSVIRTGLDGGSGGAPAAARSSVLMMAAPLLSVVDGEPEARAAVEPASSSTGSSILLGAAGQRRSRGGGTASCGWRLADRRSDASQPRRRCPQGMADEIKLKHGPNERGPGVRYA